MPQVVLGGGVPVSGVGGAFSLSPKRKVVPQVVPQVVLAAGGRGASEWGWWWWCD